MERFEVAGFSQIRPAVGGGRSTVRVLHRHLVVPFVVVPFFFICPVHTGHRGLFGVTGKANQQPATTLRRRSGGSNEKRARIRTKSLFKPDLYSLICGNRKNQTHILLLNPGVLGRKLVLSAHRIVLGL